jgi:hypothetical protein
LQFRNKYIQEVKERQFQFTEHFEEFQVIIVSSLDGGDDKSAQEALQKDKNIKYTSGGKELEELLSISRRPQLLGTNSR